MQSIILNVFGGFILAAGLLAGIPVAAQEPFEDAALVDPEHTGPGSVIWHRRFGPPWAILSVATDTAGNVLTANYTGDGSWSIIKYSAEGKRLWTLKSKARTPQLATDPARNVVVADITSSDSPGNVDAVVTKYDDSGNLLWRRQFGTSEDEDVVPNAVATDAAGNIVVAGYTGSSPNEFDAFIVKYDAYGKRLWLRQFGVPMEDWVQGVATDPAGNIVATVFTYGDDYVAKYSPSGKLLWKRDIRIGTSCDSDAGGVATDSAGSVIIAGSTYPYCILPDAYVAKYSADGKRLWTRQLGSPGEPSNPISDATGPVATDAAGNIVIAGATEGSLGGPNRGGLDAFVAKYDSGGKRLWTRQLGTGSHDYAGGVATDPAGNIVIIGGYDYDPVVSDYDAFVAKLRP